MNVYDFDKTIYDGNSTLNFYFYCLKEHPTLLQNVPKQIFASILYLFGGLNKTQFKEKFFIFLKGLKNVDVDVTNFWNKNEWKIKKWYLLKHKSTDIIISASPEFLLKPVCFKIGIKKVIASQINSKTGICAEINCYGEEKVNRLRKNLGDFQIDEFYSDSKSDLSLAKLARRAYIVSGDKITYWSVQK